MSINYQDLSREKLLAEIERLKRGVEEKKEIRACLGREVQGSSLCAQNEIK